MRVLIIKLHRFGDVVQALFVAHAARRRYPEAEITFVTGAPFAVAFEGSRDVDRLLAVGTVPPRLDAGPEVERFDDEAALGRALAGTRYDLVINLMPEANAVVLASRVVAARRVGPVAAEGSRRLLGDLAVYNATCTLHRRLARLNLIDAFCLNAGLEPGGDHDPFARLIDADRARSQAIARRLGLDPARPIVALQAASADPYRTWPPESFAAVAKQLVGRRCQAVILGSSAEAPIAEMLTALIGHDARSAAGLDLGELRAFLRGVTLLLSNDTGPLQLAAALGVPTVSMSIGFSSPIESGAYHSGALTLLADLPCAPCFDPRHCPIELRCRTSIDPASVLRAVAHGGALGPAVAPGDDGGAALLFRAEREAGLLTQRKTGVLRTPSWSLAEELVAERWFATWNGAGEVAARLAARWCGITLPADWASTLAALHDGLRRLVTRPDLPPALVPIAELGAELPALLRMAPEEKRQAGRILDDFVAGLAADCEALAGGLGG